MKKCLRYIVWIFELIVWFLKNIFRDIWWFFRFIKWLVTNICLTIPWLIDWIIHNCRYDFDFRRRMICFIFMVIIVIRGYC